MRIPLITIDRFVRDILSSIGDEDATAYVRMVRIVSSVLEEQNLRAIPNIRKTRLAVESNYTIPMPDDCIEPQLIGKELTNGYIAALGKRDDLRQFEGNDNCVTPSYFPVVTFANEDSEGIDFYWNRPDERYGRKDSRFYGYYRYDSEYNRVLIESEGISIAVGDMLAIAYRTSQVDHKCIPVDVSPAIRYMALQRFYESSDPGKAMYMFQMYRRFINDFRKQRLDKFSYQELLDAITSSFNSAPR